jgi:hypothetical protein
MAASTDIEGAKPAIAWLVAERVGSRLVFVLADTVVINKLRRTPEQTHHKRILSGI